MDATKRVDWVYSALQVFVQEAEARADAAAHLGALRLLSVMMDQLGKPEAEATWESVIQTARDRYQLPPEPADLVKVAYHAFRRGKSDIGREYLNAVPRSVADKIGGIVDLSSAVESSNVLRTALNQLMRTILFDSDVKATFQDIRLVSELRRDVISRGKMLRQRGKGQLNASTLANGLTDKVVSQIAPKSGCIAIVEWVDDGKLVAPLLTCITAESAVFSELLAKPEIDMDVAILAQQMRSRLSNWRPSRGGEPFDLQEWQVLERWLADQLTPYVAEGDHVVFIEHKYYLGLPWHVAAAPRWTSSYAPSWTALLTLHKQPARNHVGSIGVVLVPRFREEPEVANALRSSAQRTQAFSKASDLRFLMEERDNACDRDSFGKIMGSADIVKLLCHGFIDLTDGEVALMIAHE